MLMRVMFVIFLTLFFSIFAHPQGVCEACKNHGCLVSYEKAKSEKCRSCQICLIEEQGTKSRDDNDQNEEEQRDQTVKNSSDIFISITRAAEKNKAQRIKDCSKEEWKKDQACEDLGFQESMAKSASSIIGLTIGQIMLSTIGLGFILLSLRAAMNANKIAIKANGPFIAVSYTHLTLPTICSV